MAIIYSYPEKQSPSGGDFLVITDSEQTAPNKNRTKSLTIDNLADYVITSKSAITGSGTFNTLAMFTPDGKTIGDSIVTYNTPGNFIQIGAGTTIDSTSVSTTSLTASASANLGNTSAQSLTVDGAISINTGYGQNFISTVLSGGLLYIGQPIGGFTTNVFVTGFLELDQGLKDKDGNFGTAGQVLSSTGTQVEWIAGDTNTTYNLTGAVSGADDYKVVLTGSDATIDNVVFEAGTGITLADQGGNTVQIQAANNGTVTGTGTVNKLTKWSSGGTGIQNSNITDNGSLVTIASETNQTGKAVFRNGIVLSNNPGGVTVDDTSMVIGAGNNDVVSGADHSLAVGNNNQILTNSDNSIAVGQGNTLTEATASAAFGLSNTITGGGVTERSLVAGFNNSITSASSSIVMGGGNSLTSNGGIGITLGNANSVTGNQSNDSSFVLGSNNTINNTSNLQNVFMVGTTLTGATGQMNIGYRNNTSGYPAVSYNQGLGNTKMTFSVGTTTTTNSNAIIITEGGVIRGTNGVAQVPRIILPTVTSFSYTDGTTAKLNGVPVGGLFHTAGVLKIVLPTD